MNCIIFLIIKKQIHEKGNRTVYPAYKHVGRP